uniref:Uncharacterized protein n=1 Tax=Poecilia reticulata TaxID=8081 RepID=A0A3P9N006_POERE
MSFWFLNLYLVNGRDHVPWFSAFRLLWFLFACCCFLGLLPCAERNSFNPGASSKQSAVKCSLQRTEDGVGSQLPLVL